MLAENKIMDVPRHVLKRFFSDTKFPLIQHHVDSFNDLLDVGIPTFIQKSNPFELEVSGDRFVRVYIGGKDGSKIRYEPPTEEDGSAIVPHACRLDNRTYAMSIFADIDVEYTFADKTSQVRNFPNVLIGKIPLMLRSRLCYLTGLDNYAIGECKYELGGYFIIDGAEKVLLTQELLGNNMMYAGKRKRKAPTETSRGLIEKDSEYELEYTTTTNDEYYVGIRTFSEDGVRGPFSHFLTIPDYTSDIKTSQFEYTEETLRLEGRDRYLAKATERGTTYATQEEDKFFVRKSELAVKGPPAFINVRGYSQPIPLFSMFRALGITSDRDVYDTILAGVPDKERIAYDKILYQLILSHDNFLDKIGKTDLEVMAEFTRSKSRFEIVQNLHESLFSHIEGTNDDNGATFRRKAYLLGQMVKMGLDVEIGRRAPSDRDSFQFKRFKTSGVLMFEEFRRIYRDNGKDMLLRLDRDNTFNPTTYRDKNLVNLIEPENIGRYWKGYRMLNDLSKSFKGVWGDRVGISQELMRVSYLAAIHHLRKTDLQIDKSTSTAPPRRLYASQFGLMCPVDSPDGSDIGYKKSLAIFAQISTAVPAEDIKKVVRETGLIREVQDIHPSTWNPRWTKIYVNSDLWAVCIGNTEQLHQILLKARRSAVFASSVSLSWMRVNNEYKIYCDAGRPIRPVYREGTTPDMIRAATSWNDILKHLDYIDAYESDSLRISMTPYHPTLPSEIHMSFNMSALANMVPYSNHNPGPRSVFSIQQQKSAAAWYHTNYMKRFDTISEFLVLPQKPLSQTWLYEQMMGKGGCLPYGENAIVAITMYGGHNQEDSMIMNEASMRRGMYQTMYYHSYDHAEEMLDLGLETHTEIANPLKREMKRKEGFNYELLDEDGIIRVNSVVTPDTILVGMVSPITNASGSITGYRDVSVEPKRGQIGRVDAVYTYTTLVSAGDKMIGLKGVKIRIVEDRFPVVGDKMSSRHSQKGTIGQIVNEEDMPFTARGLRPDLIFNPHGIPTRMTVGQFLEAGTNKLGIELGAFVDATPFSVDNRIPDLKATLLKMGFEPHGHEVLYNGMTGEQMDADIFMGPIYYQRLKQMVEDKINYRDTGPKTMMTHQPTQGRSNEGGMRIGEMERDSLIAHGMSKFIRESFMERSDGATLQVNKETGRIDTSRDTLDMPYAMAVFTQELESMHIVPRIETK
jgi:DNA-directed RNA polymerase beta subunit